MNFSEYKGSFLFKSPSSSSHSFILGRKPDFFSPLGFDVQTNSEPKTQNIKLYSVRALKHYLNEKNLIHGQVMATTSKFSPQIFEIYFSFFFFLV